MGDVLAHPPTPNPAPNLPPNIYGGYQYIDIFELNICGMDMHNKTWKLPMYSLTRKDERTSTTRDKWLCYQTSIYHLLVN